MRVFKKGLLLGGRQKNCQDSITHGLAIFLPSNDARAPFSTLSQIHRINFRRIHQVHLAGILINKKIA
jgi:hypothetical protein